MAFTLKDGSIVSVPALYIRGTTIVVWLQFALCLLPFLVAAPFLTALLSGGLGSAEYDFAANVLGLALLGFQFLYLLSFWVVAVVSGVIPSMSALRTLRAFRQSRTVRWVFVWCVLLAILSVLVRAKQLSIGTELLVLLSAGALVVFGFTLRSLHRLANRAGRSPVFSGLDPLDQARALQAPLSFGAGRDFPVSPKVVHIAQEARNYAELARRRESNRLHIGSMTRVVAGAFIGAAGLWAFTGAPGPQLWVFGILLAIVFAGFTIERRAAFYTRLGAAYELRDLELTERRHHVKLPLRRRTAKKTLPAP